MKKLYYLALSLIALPLLLSCNEPQPEERDSCETGQLLRPAWYDENPMKTESKFSVTHEPQRLSFFGWGLEEDAVINMTFPESTEEYDRAILTYRMGAWNEGPGDWDMTTMIMIYDKNTNEYYEIVRAITPYGGYFDSTWEKYFYLDVTEYLPMLTGDVEFRVYYGGWDATETHAHTVTMTFDFYEEEGAAKTLWYNKIYDSRRDRNDGYRAFAYGLDSKPIEDQLCLKEFTVPENVESLLVKINITGHGHDQGSFPNRVGYRTRNAAEFDYNIYDFVLNGESKGMGMIYYENSNTYRQAGTYKYDRANWGPGLPVFTHYWYVANLPEDNRNFTLDLNLEEFISEGNETDTPSASYIVEVDVFGLDK